MVYYYENILVIPSKEIVALEKKKNAQKNLLLISEFAFTIINLILFISFAWFFG